MKIYGHPHSSCTRKVLLTLAEKGQEAAFCSIDLYQGEQKSEPHLARHPFGVVPVLDDGRFRALRVARHHPLSGRSLRRHAAHPDSTRARSRA